MWPTHDHEAPCNNRLWCIILESYYHLLAVKMYDTSRNFFFFLKFHFSLARRKRRDEHTRQMHHYLFLARVMLLLFLRSNRSSSDDEVVSLLWMACFFTLKCNNNITFRTSTSDWSVLFQKIPTDLIWLLLAGDLWVSKTEGLFCFLFTGSEEADQRKWSHIWTLL